MANLPNHAEVQETIRGVTATTLDYNGDWSALFDSAGIDAGPWTCRMLAWINQTLGTSYVEINGAKYAFAVSQGADDWENLDEASTFFPNGAVMTRAGAAILTRAGAYVVDTR
jgi:hypothetical protein